MYADLGTHTHAYTRQRRALHVFFLSPQSPIRICERNYCNSQIAKQNMAMTPPQKCFAPSLSLTLSSSSSSSSSCPSCQMSPFCHFCPSIFPFSRFFFACPLSQRWLPSPSLWLNLPTWPTLKEDSPHKTCTSSGNASEWCQGKAPFGPKGSRSA